MAGGEYTPESSLLRGGIGGALSSYNSREELERALAEREAAARQQEMAAYATSKAPSDLPEGSGAFMALQSILPIAIGAALMGRRGAMAGGRAAAGGADVYLKGAKEEEKNKKDLALIQAKSAGEDVTRIQKERLDLMSDRFKAQDDAAKEAADASNQPAGADTIDTVAAMFDMPREKVASLVKEHGDLGTFANLAYASGENLKHTTEGQVEKITNIKQTSENIDRALSDLRKLPLNKVGVGKVTENLSRSLKAMDTNSIEGQVASQIKMLAFGINRSIQSGNTISNADVKIVNDIIAGNWLFGSVDGIIKTLERIKDQTDDNLNNLTETMGEYGFKGKRQEVGAKAPVRLGSFEDSQSNTVGQDDSLDLASKILARRKASGG